MSIGYPKPRPRALEKQARKRAKQSVEDRENKRVRERSKGQCEVRHIYNWMDLSLRHGSTRCSPCQRRASEIHHMLGGSGRRGVGESAKAENKLHLCGPCHDLITRHILQVHWTQVEDRAGTHYVVRLT